MQRREKLFNFKKGEAIFLISLSRTLSLSNEMTHLFKLYLTTLAGRRDCKPETKVVS